MKRYLLVFTFLFLTGELLVAQKTEPTAFQYIREIKNTIGPFTSVQFWDSITNKVVKYGTSNVPLDVAIQAQQNLLPLFNQLGFNFEINAHNYRAQTALFCNVNVNAKGKFDNNWYNKDCDCLPHAGFVVNALQGGDVFELNASYLSWGVQPLQYTWDYGDGGVSDSSTSNVIKNHTYSEPGTYIVRLRVSDICGNTANATRAITVINGPDLAASIEGPATLTAGQYGTFETIVSGGTPPFHFTWSATDANATCIPVPQVGMNQTHQDVQFKEYTPILPAVVSCTVKDALGNQTTVSQSVTVEESSVEVDVHHLPALPSGLSCEQGIEAGSYQQWAIATNSLSTFHYLWEYRWDFGDGTVISTKKLHGRCEHSFISEGVYVVTVKASNLLTGAYYEVSKTYCVVNALPRSDTYTLLPSDRPVITWNSTPVSIKLTTAETFCAPMDTVFKRPKITWDEVYFPNCNYTHRLQSEDCTGDIFDEIKIPASFIPSNGIAELSKPADFTPWGCLSVRAADYTACGTAPSCQPPGQPTGAANSCIVYINPPQIKIGNIRVHAISNCEFKLIANVSGGAQKVNEVVNGQYVYEDFQYEWTAVGHNKPDVEIEGLFDNKNAKEPKLNLDHPYIQNFEQGNNVTFSVQLTVVDNAGQVQSKGAFMNANVFRIVAKDTYKRCPNSSSYLEDFPLVTGGNGNVEYTWSVVSPVGGDLNFESGDNHEPNPYIFTPSTGIVTYNLVVKMLDANGQVICQKSKNITIESSPLTLNMPATVMACANGGQIIGPEEPYTLGGSGVYGFEWSASNPEDIDRLENKFTGRTVVKNIPVGESIIYTLRVGDIMSYCEASATVEVVGVENDVYVKLDAPGGGCYGDPIELRGNANSANSNVSNPFEFTWSSDHPVMKLFQSETLGSIGILPAEMTRSNPGSYVFTLQAQHLATGCKSSSEVVVNVPDKWKYTQYESTSGVLSVVQGQEVQIWQDQSQAGGEWLSPILLKPTIKWNDKTPDIVSRSHGVPSVVKFTPSLECPRLLMTVTDISTGCSLKIASAKYIITAQPARINVALSSTSPRWSSVSKEKVTVQFDPYLLGPIPTYMPSYVMIHVHMFAGRGGTPMRLDFSPAKKLYEGEMNLADFPSGEHTLTVHYSGGDNRGVFGNSIQEKITFTVLED
jgi:PKD repeat protein